MDFPGLLKATRTSAVHLEMRDQYAVGDEAADFDQWRATGRRDADPTSDYWKPWVDLITQTRARGVTVRRARIISEPATEYIRYEHAGTDVNVAAGEQVRWLPRHQATTLLVPAVDLWIFDGTTVLFNHFTGDGNWADPDMELVTDADIVQQCTTAFERIWEHAIPHDQYKIR